MFINIESQMIKIYNSTFRGAPNDVYDERTMNALTFNRYVVGIINYQNLEMIEC